VQDTPLVPPRCIICGCAHASPVVVGYPFERKVTIAPTHAEPNHVFLPIALPIHHNTATYVEWRTRRRAILHLAAVVAAAGERPPVRMHPRRALVDHRVVQVVHRRPLRVVRRLHVRRHRLRRLAALA